ncbi:hypothetical protein FNV43_RR27237 [Rhamnella rubrinervis]|uniref:Uncharacterized protein n=1 Tax=Rhamnella rubrinervis TaxID=2594499 RepID=A0A8K0DK06_9ROSA|nr:hypothetical protein FNV43_RR27237 [Rhamnella rubrinervis]
MVDLMVNCGGASGASDVMDVTVDPRDSSTNDTWVHNATVKALSKAFPGQVNWKKMPDTNGENYLALTGPLPDLVSWSDMATSIMLFMMMMDSLYALIVV